MEPKYQCLIIEVWSISGEPINEGFSVKWNTQSSSHFERAWYLFTFCWGHSDQPGRTVKSFTIIPGRCNSRVDVIFSQYLTWPWISTYLYIGVPESFLYQRTRYTLSLAPGPEAMSQGSSACPPSTVATRYGGLGSPASALEHHTTGKCHSSGVVLTSIDFINFLQDFKVNNDATEPHI